MNPHLRSLPMSGYQTTAHILDLVLGLKGLGRSVFFEGDYMGLHALNPEHL